MGITGRMGIWAWHSAACVRPHSHFPCGLPQQTPNINYDRQSSFLAISTHSSIIKHSDHRIDYRLVSLHFSPIPPNCLSIPVSSIQLMSLGFPTCRLCCCVSLQYGSYRSYSIAPMCLKRVSLHFFLSIFRSISHYKGVRCNDGTAMMHYDAFFSVAWVVVLSKSKAALPRT